MKPNLQDVFRWLVITSTICYLLLAFSPWIFWHGIPQDTIDVLSWRGADAILPLPNSVLWLLVLLWVAIAVGLFQFSPQARWLFAILAGFDLVATLLAGIMTMLAVEAFLMSVSTLMNGAVLALAYFSPLKETFECYPPNSEQSISTESNPK